MAHLNHPIYLPAELLEALGEEPGIFWSHPDIENEVCDAIRAWINRPPADAPQAAEPLTEGYQWKQVFLPTGTSLRASFAGEAYFAVVQGSEILAGDVSSSPSRFANLKGSGNRNAWKAVWLRFPGTKLWIRADVCRVARITAMAKHLGVEVPEVKIAPAGLCSARLRASGTGMVARPSLRHAPPAQASPPGVAHAAHAPEIIGLSNGPPMGFLPKVRLWLCNSDCGAF